MTRTLTIISFAGIVVLALIPVLFLGRYPELPMDNTMVVQPTAARALFVTLVVIGATISGAGALIVIRLFDRYLRG
jgi:hypothetical protein